MVEKEYGYKLISNLQNKHFSAIVLAVSHKEFENIDIDLIKAEDAVVYDVKGFYKEGVDGRL